MVSIFAKARICQGNTQVHLQFFWKSKLQQTQKCQSAAQMDCSSASSETSFHGLPSTNKHPSITKHSVVVIIAVYYQFLRNTHLQRDFQQIFLCQYFCVRFENSSSASSYVPKSFRKFTKIRPRQSPKLVKLQAFTEATTGCVL